MRYLLLLFVLAARLGCSDSDKVSPICEDCEIDCSLPVIIDAQAYDNQVSYPINIIDAYIEDDCLRVSFDFTGCGESLTLKLYDAGTTEGNNPIKRQIKLVLGDAGGGCNLEYSKDRGFDLSPTRELFTNQIVFQLEGWDEPLAYSLY